MGQIGGIESMPSAGYGRLAGVKGTEDATQTIESGGSVVVEFGDSFHCTGYWGNLRIHGRPGCRNCVQGLRGDAVAALFCTGANRCCCRCNYAGFWLRDDRRLTRRTISSDRTGISNDGPDNSCTSNVSQLQGCATDASDVPTS